MAEQGKKVEVRFGAFTCSIEGYDNPVEQLREVLGLMQRVIDETPALAQADPEFDAARIEDAIDRKGTGADGTAPGIVVIRNAEAEQPDASDATPLADAAPTLDAQFMPDTEPGVDAAEDTLEGMVSQEAVEPTAAPEAPYSPPIEETNLSGDITTEPVPDSTSAKTETPDVLLPVGVTPAEETSAEDISLTEETDAQTDDEPDTPEDTDEPKRVEIAAQTADPDEIRPEPVADETAKPRLTDRIRSIFAAPPATPAAPAVNIFAAPAAKTVQQEVADLHGVPDTDATAALDTIPDPTDASPSIPDETENPADRIRSIFAAPPRAAEEAPADLSTHDDMTETPEPLPAPAAADLASFVEPAPTVEPMFQAEPEHDLEPTPEPEPEPEAHPVANPAARSMTERLSSIFAPPPPVNPAPTPMQAPVEETSAPLESAPEAPAERPSRFEAMLNRAHGGSPVDAPGTISGNTVPDEAGPIVPEGTSAADLSVMGGDGTVAGQLEAAAAWLTLVKGTTRFSRREVMEVLESIPATEPRALADRIKGFGQLVRSGSLVLVDDGVFAMAQTGRDRFQALLDQA